jgi:hypothetical protein
VYPAFRTFRVLQNGSKAEMKPWLAYWTVLGLLHCTEYLTDTVIFWYFVSYSELLGLIW